MRATDMARAEMGTGNDGRRDEKRSEWILETVCACEHRISPDLFFRARQKIKSRTRFPPSSQSARREIRACRVRSAFAFRRARG